MPDTEHLEIRFYWRPGCGFCARLGGQLDVAGIAVQPLNIWDDESAAAFVRSVARGHETVPTLTIGAESLVNPSIDEVIAAIARN